MCTMRVAVTVVFATFSSVCAAGEVPYEGIDTLTAAVGRNAPPHGSGREPALPPDGKGLGAKLFEYGARKKVALDVEGVLDGGVYRQEALS